ncbi:hypothetical protein M3Y99_00180200 [Aphelenchoides fujianensis]|nr:hypothetical protein M3Y99_00180200 [Aphelenchoides fujianensis]
MMDGVDWGGIFEAADPDFGRPPTPPHPILVLEMEAAQVPKQPKPPVEEYIPQKLRHIQKVKNAQRDDGKNVLLEEAAKRLVYMNKTPILQPEPKEETPEAEMAEAEAPSGSATDDAELSASSASAARPHHSARVSMGKSRMGRRRALHLLRVPKKRTRRSAPKRTAKIRRLPTSAVKKKLAKELKRAKFSNSKKGAPAERRVEPPVETEPEVSANESASEDNATPEDSRERGFHVPERAARPCPPLRVHYVQPVIAEVYDKNRKAMRLQTRQMTDLCKATLAEIRKQNGRYWLLLEEPFHGANDALLEQGHAFVTRIPKSFRFSLLPDVLKACNFKGVKLTHIVVNLTLKSLRAFGVLGVPIEDAQYRTMNENLQANMQQAIINLRFAKHATGQKATIRFIPFEGTNADTTTASLGRLPQRLDHFFKGEYPKGGIT